jgi:hypothetical protein
MQMFVGLEGQGWSEYLSYRFTPGETDGVFIPFPFYERPNGFFADAVLDTVRLDLEKCGDCRLVVERAEWVDRFTQDLADRIPPNLQFPVLPQPPSEDIRQKGPWRTFGMQRLPDGAFRLGEDDPHLVSPELNVPLRSAKGLFLRMAFASRAPKRMFQLFWDTYSTGFQELQSIRFLADLKEGVAEVYIPFPAFHRNDLLKTVRLDVYGIPGEELRVSSARVVDSETEALLARVPKHLMYAPGAAVDAASIVVDSLQRVTVDKVFLGGYLLLLASVVLAMTWVWKKEG